MKKRKITKVNLSNCEIVIELITSGKVKLQTSDDFQGRITIN